ncbi:MAG: RNA polymerase sigma factor, partial [Ktedonobacteraceae bacterium]|nr:RNA polymerase sigma factor [Ktedonobacteraceae bacterium]
MQQQPGEITEAFLLPAEERAQLVGLCRKLTHNQDVAEDLAQETLLLAWRDKEALRNPEKRRQWIAGIARNVSLRWLRQYGRELAQRTDPPQNVRTHSVTTLEDLVADEFDVEVALERQELINLLDRALAELPAETRSALIKRYVEESPLAEIAAQLGTNVSTVAMRLQRGKLTLRKILTSEMLEEIAAYEPIAAAPMWLQTSLWCHRCGIQRLLGRKQPECGLLYLKCPGCDPDDAMQSKTDALPVLQGIHSFKPAFNRLAEWSHIHYRQALRDGWTTCETCGRRVRSWISSAEELRLRHHSPIRYDLQDERLVTVVCDYCHSLNYLALHELVMYLPQGRTFARTHPRIRLLPSRSIEFAGRPALVTSFASVTDSASFEVISDFETYEVLAI